MEDQSYIETYGHPVFDNYCNVYFIDFQRVNTHMCYWDQGLMFTWSGIFILILEYTIFKVCDFFYYDIRE